MKRRASNKLFFFYANKGDSSNIVYQIRVKYLGGFVLSKNYFGYTIDII